MGLGLYRIFLSTRPSIYPSIHPSIPFRLVTVSTYPPIHTQEYRVTYLLYLPTLHHFSNIDTLACLVL